METSFQPYEGSEPYIFVSYARKDSGQVAPLLDALNFAGYRVWYDSGIQSGKRWADSLAEHIAGCSVFMPLISSAFSDSVYCYDETAYALTKKRAISPVYLEENVILPPGLEMRLHTLQWRKLSDYSGNVTLFIQSLESEELLKPCHLKNDAEKTGTSVQKFPTKFLLLKRIGVVLLLMAVIYALTIDFLRPVLCLFSFIYILVFYGDKLSS